MSETLALQASAPGPAPITELRTLVASYNQSARPGRRIHTVHLRAVYARGAAAAPSATFAHVYGMSRAHSFLSMLASCSTPVNPLTPDRDLLPPHHPLSLRSPEAANPVRAARPLIASIIIDSLGRPWRSFLHPRDRYGKFIPTLGGLQLFKRGSSGVSDKHYATGRYVGANPDGSVQVRLNAIDDPNQQGQIGETITVPADQVATIGSHGRNQKANIGGTPSSAEDDTIEYRNAVTQDAFDEGVDRLGDKSTPAVNIDGTPYQEGDRITTEVHSETGGQDEISSRSGVIRNISTTKDGKPNALIEFDGEPDEENPDGKPELAILDLSSPDISKAPDTGAKATLPSPVQTQEARVPGAPAPDVSDVNRRSGRTGIDRPAAARLFGFEQTGERMTAPNADGESFGVGHIVQIVRAARGQKSKLTGIHGFVANIDPTDGGARLYYRDPESGKWKQTKGHFAVNSMKGALPADPDVIAFMADAEGEMRRAILPGFKRFGVSNGEIDKRVATGYDGIDFHRAYHVAGRRGSDNRVVQGIVQNIHPNDGTIQVQPYGGGEAIVVGAKYVRYVSHPSSKYNGGNQEDVHVGPQEDAGTARPDRESLKDTLYAAGFSDETIDGIDKADPADFGDIIRADEAFAELERREAAVAVLDETDPARHASQARADRMYGEVVRSGIAARISGETIPRKPPENQVTRESIKDEIDSIFPEDYFGPQGTPETPETPEPEADTTPEPDTGDEEDIPGLPTPPPAEPEAKPTPEPDAEAPPKEEAPTGTGTETPEPEIEPITDSEFRTHVYPNALENWTTDKGRYPESDADYAEVDQWAEILRQSYNDGSDQAGWRDDPRVSEETANERWRKDHETPTPEPTPTPEQPPTPEAPAESPVSRAIRQYTTVAGKLAQHPDPGIQQFAKDVTGLVTALQSVQDASDRGVESDLLGSLMAGIVSRVRGIQDDHRPLFRRLTGPGSTPQQKNIAMNGMMRLLKDAQNIGQGGERSLTPDTNPRMFDPAAPTVTREVATPTPDVPETPGTPEAPAAPRSLPEQALDFPDAAVVTPEEMDQAFADLLAGVDASTGISPIQKERAKGALTRARRAVEKSYDPDRTADERENLLHAAADRLDQVGGAVGGDLGDTLGVIGGKLETLGGDLPVPGLPRPPAARGPKPGSPIPRAAEPRPTPRAPEPGAPVRRMPPIPSTDGTPTPTPTPARPTPARPTPAAPETTPEPPSATNPPDWSWDVPEPTPESAPEPTPETPAPPTPEPEPEANTTGPAGIDPEQVPYAPIDPSDLGERGEAFLRANPQYSVLRLDKGEGTRGGYIFTDPTGNSPTRMMMDGERWLRDGPDNTPEDYANQVEAVRKLPGREDTRMLDVTPTFLAESDVKAVPTTMQKLQPKDGDQVSEDGKTWYSVDGHPGQAPGTRNYTLTSPDGTREVLPWDTTTWFNRNTPDNLLPEQTAQAPEAPTPEPTPAPTPEAPATPAAPEAPAAPTPEPEPTPSSAPGEKDWDFTLDEAPTGTTETPLPLPEPEPEEEPEVDLEPPAPGGTLTPLPEEPEHEPFPDPEPFPEPPPPDDKIDTSELDAFSDPATLPKESGRFEDTPLEVMDDLHSQFLATRNGLVDQGADLSGSPDFGAIASATRSMRNSGRLSGSFNEWLRGRGPEGDKGTGADGRELLGRLIEAYNGGANTQGALGRVVKDFEREWLEKHDYFRTPPPPPDPNTPEARAKNAVDTIMEGVDPATFHDMDDDDQNAALAKAHSQMEVLYRVSKFDTNVMTTALADQFEKAGVDRPKSAAQLSIKTFAGLRGIERMTDDGLPLHADPNIRMNVGRVYAGLTDPAPDVSMINISMRLFIGNSDSDHQIRADSARAMAQLIAHKREGKRDDIAASVKYYNDFAEATLKGDDPDQIPKPKINIADEPNFRRKDLGGTLGMGYASTDGNAIMVKAGSGYWLSIAATQEEILAGKSTNGLSLQYYRGQILAPVGTYRGPATATPAYKQFLTESAGHTSFAKEQGKRLIDDSKLRDARSFAPGAQNWGEVPAQSYNTAKKQAGLNKLREMLSDSLGQRIMFTDADLEPYLGQLNMDRFVLPSARVFRNGNVNIEIGDDTLRLWGDNFDANLALYQGEIAKLMGVRGVHDRPVAIRISNDSFELVERQTGQSKRNVLGWAIMGNHTIQLKGSFPPYANRGGVAMVDQTNGRSDDHGWMESVSGKNTALTALGHEWGHMTDISDEELSGWRIEVQNDLDRGKTDSASGGVATVKGTTVRLDSGEIEWFNSDTITNLAHATDPKLSSYSHQNEHELRAELFSEWVATNGTTTSPTARFLFGTDQDRKEVLSVWFQHPRARSTALDFPTQARYRQLVRDGMSNEDAAWQAFREKHGYYNRSVSGHGSAYQVNIGLGGDQQFNDRIFGINNALNASQLAQLKALADAAGAPPIPTPTPVPAGGTP